MWKFQLEVSQVSLIPLDGSKLEKQILGLFISA